MTRRQLLTLPLALWVGDRPNIQAPPAFRHTDLAAYRLTQMPFKRFAHASRLIGKVIRSDARYAREPLITREIWVDGDAAEMATALHARLQSDTALSAALFAADISAREYAAFALALFAAHLAHGFVKSGAIRRVPAGVAAENVAFVAANHAEILEVLKQLKLE